MTKINIKKFLATKRSPTLALLETLEKMEGMSEVMAKRVLASIEQTVKQKMEEVLNRERLTMTDEMEREVRRDVVERTMAVILPEFQERIGKLRGKDGNPGADGNNPTSEALIKLIEPLIPAPIKGDKGDVPIKGLDFDDGQPGLPGKSVVGPPGPPGNPADIDAKIVVKKINDLPLDPKFKIDASHIKNLPRTKKDKKGGGGGGMGNVIHDQFDGDGATTAFTLTSKVAGNGTAVMGCRYEGQTQFLGDQFTISGKTLTMTFIPEDGTKIEITYIRT